MDRDKLIEVLKQKECPLGKITRNNIYDVTTELADFLIANGIGDITTEKHRVDVAEEALTLACEAFYCLVNDKEESNEKTVNQLVEYFKEQALNG